MTEVDALKQTLLAEYGETVVAQAAELSGLTTCLAALGADELKDEERERIFRQAALHLQQLVDTLMPASVSAKVTECAKRIDVAVDLAMLDDIEKRDGLPPA